MGTIDENGWLKECPFCGSEARYRRESYYPIRHYAKHTVSCTKCLAGSIIADTKEGVISDWNNRVSDSPKQPDSSGENEGRGVGAYSGMRAAFEKLVMCRYDIERYGRMYPQSCGLYMDNATQALWGQYQADFRVSIERLLAGVDVEEVTEKVAQSFGYKSATREAAQEAIDQALASIKRQLDKQGVK